MLQSLQAGNFDGVALGVFLLLFFTGSGAVFVALSCKYIVKLGDMLADPDPDDNDDDDDDSDDYNGNDTDDDNGGGAAVHINRLKIQHKCDN